MKTGCVSCPSCWLAGLAGARPSNDFDTHGGHGPRVQLNAGLHSPLYLVQSRRGAHVPASAVRARSFIVSSIGGYVPQMTQPRDAGVIVAALVRVR
jgi:hypothetical protein